MEIYLKVIKLEEDILENISKYEIIEKPKGYKIIDLLQERYPEGFESDTEIYINSNSEPLDINEYGTKIIEENDLITINHRVGWNFIIQAVIMIVLSLVIAYLTTPEPYEQPVIKSVYNTNSNQIKAKFGDPIMINYGDFRFYPALVAKDYNFYVGQNQYTVIHTCLGIGNQVIKNLWINDTKIDFSGYKNQSNNDKKDNLVGFAYSGSNDFQSHLMSGPLTSQQYGIPSEVLENFKYEVYSPDALKNVTFRPLSYSSTGELVEEETSIIEINPDKTSINTILVSGSYPGGAYATDTVSSGGIGGALGKKKTVEISVNVTILVNIYRVYDNDDKILVVSENIAATGTGTDMYHDLSYLPFIRKTSGVFHSNSHSFTKKFDNLPMGRYSVEVKRTDFKEENETSTFNLTSVVGYKSQFSSSDGSKDVLTSQLSNVTMASFVIKTNPSLAKGSGFTVNVQTQRVPDDYNIHNGTIGDNVTDTVALTGYNTLLDFVKDIWTNTDYGMGEDLRFLDIRGELGDRIGMTIDTTETAYDHLKNVLKSFGYVIFPYLNKFVIKRETAISYRSMLFSSKNATNIKYTYTRPSEDDFNKGIELKYIAAGEVNVTSYKYPEDALKYNEIFLRGVVSPNKLEEMAQFYLDKQRYVIKSCSLTTDIRGMIPELFSRIGVSKEYIDGEVVASSNSINFDTGIALQQNIFLSSNEPGENYYCGIIGESGYDYGVFMLADIIEDKEYNTLYFGEAFPTYIEELCSIFIGKIENKIDDFLVSGISMTEDTPELGAPAQVNLELSDYVEHIYRYSDGDDNLENDSNFYYIDGKYKTEEELLSAGNTGGNVSVISNYVDISASATDGLPGHTVYFSFNYHLNFSSLAQVEWDFGDGSPVSNDTNPSHTYADTGIYTVKLTLTDTNNDDIIDEEIDLVEIFEDSEVPNADFTADVQAGLAPLTVTYTNTSEGVLFSELNWEFPGGRIVNDSPLNEHPVVIYENEGFFDAKLTAVNDKGSSLEHKTGFVTVSADTQMGLKGIVVFNPATVTRTDIGDTTGVGVITYAPDDILGDPQPGVFEFQYDSANTILFIEADQDEEATLRYRANLTTTGDLATIKLTSDKDGEDMSTVKVSIKIFKQGAGV